MSDTSKTIIANGSQHERVAQACDRCRAKKTKCDGKKPCTNCLAVGFECKISDKLSRRAFPRGYTETLEERIRMLEVENKKLLGLLDVKDRQLQRTEAPLVSPPELVAVKHETTALPASPVAHEPHDGCCDNFPHPVHERAVLWAEGAEGAGASTREVAEALRAAGADPSPRNLAAIVASCLPRSTEEVLFIPTVMAKLAEYHGFDSPAVCFTTRALAGLKDYVPAVGLSPAQLGLPTGETPDDVRAPPRPGRRTPDRFWATLHLPPRPTMDLLVAEFVQQWNTLLPIVDETELWALYRSVRFQACLDGNDPDEGDAFSEMQSFGMLLVFVCAFGLLSQKGEYCGSTGAPSATQCASINLLNHYDALIHEFIQSPAMAADCSIRSLTFLSLALNYCCNVGDVASACQLRARVVAVTHQLRLHRCPAAVLTLGGAVGDVRSQDRRRVLFWCAYTLDCFLSLILGVPRLVKDTETECALPVSSGVHGGATARAPAGTHPGTPAGTSPGTHPGTPAVTPGTVRPLAHSLFRFAQIVGNIIDTIYGCQASHDSGTTLYQQENRLETWRKQLLPPHRFSIDVNGMLKTDLASFRTWEQILVIFLYYQARILIYSSVLLAPATAHSSRLTTAFIVIQQSAIQILHIFTHVNAKRYHFPIPWSPSHIQARMAIIAARGVLEYSRGGALFHDLRQILRLLVAHLRRPSACVVAGGDAVAGKTVPGCFSAGVSALVELAVESILMAPGLAEGPPPQVTAPVPTPPRPCAPARAVFSRKSRFAEEPRSTIARAGSTSSLFGLAFESHDGFGADASVGLFPLAEVTRPLPASYDISPGDIEYFVSLAKSPHAEGPAGLRSMEALPSGLPRTGSFPSALFEAAMSKSPSPSIFDYVALFGADNGGRPHAKRPAPQFRESAPLSSPKRSAPESQRGVPAAQLMMRGATYLGYEDPPTAPSVASQSMTRGNSLFSWQGDTKRGAR